METAFGAAVSGLLITIEAQCLFEGAHFIRSPEKKHLQSAA